MKNNIPKIIYTKLFLKALSLQIYKFKANKGFGHWLVEYEKMNRAGLFEPKAVQKQYIQLLKKEYPYGFMEEQAINYICNRALDYAETIAGSNSFEIRLITGEIAFDNFEKELKNLSFEDAFQTCTEMNKEAEEHLFEVYLSPLLVL